MRNRRDLLAGRADRSRCARPRDALPVSPRARWTEDLDRAARAGRSRARTSFHHRPDDRRPADRERGRATPHRRQRRALRLRTDPDGAGRPGPPAADALGQRDRAPPLRGHRNGLPRAAPGRVRPAPLGRVQPGSLRGARSLRDQAALLRLPPGPPLLRLRGEGALRGRSAGALEPRHDFAGREWRRTSRANALRRRLPGIARPLPAGDARRDPRASVLGLRLPARRRGHARRRRCRECRAPPGCPRRSRPAASAGRCPGRLLPQRRAGLLLGDRPRGETPLPPDPGVHADIRFAGLRRERHRTGDGGPVGRRVLPGADSPGRSRRPLRGCDLARGDSLLQRARRRQVRSLARGARRRIQGRSDGGGFRRDLRRLSPFPTRHAALRQRRPGSRGRPGSARAARACQPGVPRSPPSGRRGRVDGGRPANAGVHAVVDRGDLGRPLQDAGPPDRGRSGGVLGPRLLPRAAQQPRRSRSAGRTRAGPPVALPLEQDDPRDLHPRGPGRPHGDGALRRRARAVSGPQSRGARGVAAGRRRRSGA